MMQFDVVTIFPDIFDSYLNESILKRAQKKKIIKVKTHNIRKQTADKHKTVDDKPYGGGAGMVLMAEPIIKTVNKITKGKQKKKTKIIVFSAKGKQFNQQMAYNWSRNYNQIIMVCGRYEGIDERVKDILKAEEISIGPYVLTDGEVAAMTIVSAVGRLLPNVINWKSLEEESYFNNLIAKENEAPKVNTLEYPHYTRPEIIIHKGKKYSVPKVLLSGNHAEIKKWRDQKSKK